MFYRLRLPRRTLLRYGGNADADADRARHDGEADGERGGTDPGEYVAVNMSLRVKSWCDILRAE